MEYIFGNLSDGREVRAARLENASGLSLTVLDYGASIQSLCVPDRHGKPVDVVLGYETAEEYEAGDCYLGATVGRVCNRIGGSSFSLGNKIYRLASNDGGNHLHGGLSGFDRKIWDMDVREDRIICSRISPDGEEGYPGNLAVTVTFLFTDANSLEIVYEADTDRDTPVSLTNHSYFNLNGKGDILDHELQINADHICELDSESIPTGQLLPVSRTPFDFRTGRRIGASIESENDQLKMAGGYDHNFCLNGDNAATLHSEASGITMTLETDMPGIQLYTGNFLTVSQGKNGQTIRPRSGLALETQHWPDALNHADFPSPSLKAGEHMKHISRYIFT